MENAGVVDMRKRGPRVSRAGRIPFPPDQSPDLLWTLPSGNAMVPGSCLTAAAMVSWCVNMNMNVNVECECEEEESSNCSKLTQLLQGTWYYIVLCIMV
mmetsp:Transcript_1961/g.2838  ORF Transcript_1961/g.2838 Transcript_1961/m.2838 type:complete len:99 (+) Transcript_1961:832-1128(+)